MFVITLMRYRYFIATLKVGVPWHLCAPNVSDYEKFSSSYDSFHHQVAMQLLEKDIHDKQDTLISLRRQLEDIKKINLDLHTKWQVKIELVYEDNVTENLMQCNFFHTDPHLTFVLHNIAKYILLWRRST